jgi:acetyl/propionyl-CoA carboxylase alpha subunit
MLKAAMGGGGKGMRRIDSADALPGALRAAQSEAAKSFGDDAVYVEKLVLNPRHVEIQVLADGFGNVVHLFERDCSVQRRHQKVVEEAPCPVLDPATREAMTSAACDAARAVNYVGAGTVEFLLGQDGGFYFLEMNTRLQVEHPITEMITGVDLVQAQFRVARGEKLWFGQEDLKVHGHSIECRIYAEDVRHQFRPAPGKISHYVEPQGPFVRVDSGVSSLSEVPIFYDPMVAKLIVWGQNRDEALRRCSRALREFRIVGVLTTIPLFHAILDDERFQSGKYDTSFLSSEWLEGNVEVDAPDLEVVLAFGAILRQMEAEDVSTTTSQHSSRGSDWKSHLGWKRHGRS